MAVPVQIRPRAFFMLKDIDMDDLVWLIRDYCEILYGISKGDANLEWKRQEKHSEIAKFLGCDRESISVVLHNITIDPKDGYLFLETANILRKLKKENLI